jgi:mRNA interferase MazF
MIFEQGDLVLIRYPFSNQIDYKIRPAIIVSNNSFNKKFDSWACPVSSKNKNNYFEITNFVENGNLDKKSFVKTDAIASLDSNLVLKKLGKINSEKINLIINKIISNF